MRVPVSGKQNVWFDAQTVDDTNLTLEQNYNNQIQSSIINNHFGSGVLPDALIQPILFDSNNAVGLLDGKSISIQTQPSDSNNGNQLEIELTGSAAAGNRTIKLLIIGLDFQNNLQYDRIIFHRNEKQVTAKHYKTILSLFFNDLYGVQNQSLNLGGRIVIRETKPFSISRDCIMISQDTMPNLFFRDFFTVNNSTLLNALELALPSYNIDNLNITTQYKQLRAIVENDVSSQVAQKFLATTNNIQKITLLLSVVNNSTPSNLVWTGDIIVSIYALQSTVSCPTDIIPNLAIEFDPSNIPLAQLSLTYNDLLNQGVQLNGTPQPVDFVFSNTPVGSGLSVTPGNYYVIAVKRAGSPDTCQIQFATGVNNATNTRETLFNGSVWVDIPEESLWFQVWTDAAKVSDGQAYDTGHGIQIPKTILDPTTNTTVDYCLNKIQFTRNDLFYALAQAATQKSNPVQDQRTGNAILSQQQYVPSISLINSTALAQIQSTSNPLIVGTITDKNVKALNSSLTTLTGAIHEYGLVENQLTLKVITDPTDGYRYDTNIINLMSEAINGTLSQAKFITNISNPSLYYRIVKTELLTMMYGDVNGDGIIDNNDLVAANALLNYNLNTFPTHDQYITQTTYFISEQNTSWSLYNPLTSSTVTSGIDGYVTVNPTDGTLANFSSASTNFSSYSNLNNYELIITAAANPGNKGTFSITSSINNTTITIQKQYYTSDKILQILRADITGDMLVDSNDYNYISNYVNAVSPFPPTTSPANKIGTTFTALRFTFEPFVDRADDYPNNYPNRIGSIHPTSDPFLDGYSSFGGQNVKTNPITFNIVKQLSWEPYNVVTNSSAKMVPCSFESQTGFVLNNCNPPGVVSQIFPTPPTFDPGKNDFFIPNNLIINSGGNIIGTDGYLFKMDFEIGNIILEIPPVNFTAEKTINIFTDFVANYTGSGYTATGSPAMKFADCSFVGMDALTKNQVVFSVAQQSFSPLLSGTDGYGVSGDIISEGIGVSINQSTGILTLQFNNLYQDPVQQTLNTKVQVNVMLKKAGWNNTPQFVSSTKLQHLLGM